MENLLFIIPDYIDKSKNYIEVFGFQIYYYAIAITLGMLACVLLAIPLIRKRGMKADFLLDLMIGIIPCSIICARLWYVLFDINSFESFYDVINIRDGGMAIYGGVAGGALGIVIVCKITKKSINKVFDIGAVMLPIGQAIGRWGNYFNQEVYGAVDPNKIGLPVSVYIQATGDYHYALFLWESVLNIILFIALYVFLYKYKGKRNGYTTAFYFMGYGFIRMFMEPMRDAQYNLPLFGIESLGMVWVSILVILGGFAIWAVNFAHDIKICNNNLSEYSMYMFGRTKRAKTSKTAENTQKQINNKTDDVDMGSKDCLVGKVLSNLQFNHITYIVLSGAIVLSLMISILAGHSDSGPAHSWYVALLGSLSLFAGVSLYVHNLILKTNNVVNIIGCSLVGLGFFWLVGDIFCPVELWWIGLIVGAVFGVGCYTVKCFLNLKRR